MPSKILDSRSPSKIECTIASVLLFNAFSWYLMVYSMIGNIVQGFSEGSLGSLSLRFAYPFSIIVSALLGSILLTNINKVRFFSGWVFIGVTASLFSSVLSSFSFAVQLLIVVLLGSSLGMGMPFLLSYFTEFTVVENRGKIGGLIFFTTMVSTVLFRMVMPTLSQTLTALAFAGWRGWSFLALHFVPKHVNEQKHRDKWVQPSATFLNNRTFLLYFVAWFMFALVDGFGSNIVSLHGNEFRGSFKFVELAIISLSALVSGVFADRIGRKRVVTFGFVSLGVAYAVLGLVPDMWFSWLFYFIVDGLAVGSLWVLFTIVIWGEIAGRQIEKYYAIGEAPYFLTGMVSLILTPLTLLIPKTSAFSLAAFFLFLAVVPLIYAPETLPEKKIRERELREYIEKTKKIKEKFT